MASALRGFLCLLILAAAAPLADAGAAPPASQNSADCEAGSSCRAAAVVDCEQDDGGLLPLSIRTGAVVVLGLTAGAALAVPHPVISAGLMSF